MCSNFLDTPKKKKKLLGEVNKKNKKQKKTKKKGRDGGVAGSYVLEVPKRASPMGL